MAKLSAADRHALPASDFVFPETRQFPIPDRNHALVALRDCGRVPGTCAKVKAAVCRKFGLGC